ncbi:UDP-glucuronate 4-epimerase 6-like [Olea europaea var. sylvestris]|uniref:UDP-glucuronate 4-epimerase n=1 Tax=Olea europaea subsp. europaea TaxID=158383 RepID=A0A8S0TQ18_OLEEU|nr:UDP-glucuronate 4-epimerase 6-like [Olea europaea var. sylvestris]CAA3007367.1 UDP-glucuronate 4-epimerase 6-like [Olea europaea subsp. europaea]
MQYHTMVSSPPDTSKTTKLERYNSYIRRVNSTKLLQASSKLLFRVTLLVALVLILLFTLNYPPISENPHHIHAKNHLFSSGFYGSGAAWEKQVRHSATPSRPNGFSVLVTGAAGFVGTHCSLALKKRGDGVLGLDNFNSYYDPSLKMAREKLLGKHQIFVVHGDINAAELLNKLFDIVPFSHVLHLAAQAGVRYAMQNPLSYVNSNVAGFVNLLEVAKSAEPQPAIVWASSSSVYGLNTQVPFSEDHRTDQPASLYAATKKAGEEIAHTYNHIYGLSLTGLRFFTVYGPWGRPDMAYFFFTKDILQRKPINVYVTQDGKEVARDFTYIDDIVKGCVGALDTAEKSTGRGGKKRAPAQLRVYNLGNTAPVTVNKLVGILESLLNVKAKKHMIKMPRNGDVPYTHANVSQAYRDFGYKPTTDLATGLRKFTKWYTSYYGIESRVKKEIQSDD